MMARRRLLLLAALLTMTARGAGAEAEPPPQAAVPAAARYFPDDAWGDRTEFMEGWFGNQLRAMGEPVLSAPEHERRFRRRLRMLVLPAFHPAYAIRVDEGAGGGRVLAVRLDGTGGYDPGRVAESESYRIGRADLRLIDREIAASGVMTMSADFSPPGDEEVIYVCADGAYFVFEIADSDGAHVVARHKCELTPGLRRLVEFMDDLRVEVRSDLARYLD